MSLKDIVPHISMIRNFFVTNETLLRTLDLEKRTQLIGHVKSALSRILQALSIANLTLDESGRQTVEETCRMLPIFRSIAPNLDLALVEEWISLLLPKIYLAPVSLQPSMVQVVQTLFSFVQIIGLAAFRTKFAVDVGANMKILANAILASPFAPVTLQSFGVVSLSTWSACVSMQSCLMRLCSLMMPSSSVFVSDLLPDCWFAACTGLGVQGAPLLVEASLELLIQLVTRNNLPPTVEDTLMRGVCMALRSRQSREIDHVLASCIELCISRVSVLSLHASSDAYFTVAIAAVRETASERLRAALLSSFQAFQDSCRSNNVALLVDLVSVLDHQAELAKCLSHASARPLLNKMLSSVVFSSNLDATALLQHCRVVTLVVRVLLGSVQDGRSDVELALSKVTSLLLTLNSKVKPRDLLAWCSHLALIFRLSKEFGPRFLPLFGKESFEALSALLLGNLMMSSSSPAPPSAASPESLLIETRIAWVEALGSVAGLPLGKVKDAIMGCIVRQNNQLLFDRSLQALIARLKSWSAASADQGQMQGICKLLAAELLAEAMHAQVPPPRVEWLIRAAGMCVCAAAACWREKMDGKQSCCKQVVPWTNWAPLIEILKSKAADAVVLVAALETLARYLRHIGPNATDLQRELESFIFPFAWHEASSVRSVFSETLVPSLCSALPQLVPPLQKKLMSSFQQVSTSCQASVLAALAKVAIFEESPDSKMFVIAFYALIRSFHHKELDVRAAAYDGVREVARARRLTEAQLFARHEDEIFSLLVKQLSHEPALLEEVAMFLDQTPIELLKRTLPNWLPKLVSEPAPEVLEEVASWLGVSLSELLTAHCVSVCLHIVLEEPGFETATAFLVKATGEQLDELMDSWMHDLMRELVVMMGESNAVDRIKCEQGIGRLALARFRRRDPARSKPLAKSEMAEFVSNNFLAIMEHIDNLLLPSNANLAEHRSAILGFDQLVDLMARGNSIHLISLRPKIIATLKLALKLPDLQLEACSTYRRFLDRLGIENIGPILGQIVVDLLPYIAQESSPQLSQLVVEILEWLIVDNRKKLEAHFTDVHFLPDVPSLSRVRKVLDKGSVGLVDTLEQLTVGLQYESVDVRLMAVKKLMVVLRNHRKEIDAKILQRHRVAPIIEKLLPHLLSGSKGMSSAEAKGQYAACLGFLGAIDPGRVDLRLRLDLQMQLDDLSLAIELLNNHLVLALEEARNTETQGSAAFGRAAFAIQEVLKFCNCREDTPNLAAMADGGSRLDRKKKEGIFVWNKLLPKTQAIVRPYLASCYQLTDESVPAPRSATYYSIYVQFRRWVGNFAAYLISRVPGSSIDLFSACRSSVKDHDHIARFLLPYLVLRLAQHEPEMLKLEMHAVLRAEPSKSADMSQLCTQTVFHTIDVLVHWVEEKRKQVEEKQRHTLSAAVPSKSKKSKNAQADDAGMDDLPADYLAVCSLLASIPQLMIAKAALRCGAFARALKAVETHVREEQYGKDDAAKTAVLGAVVPLLQQIFGGLEGL